MRTVLWISLLGLVLPISVLLATSHDTWADEAAATIERLITQLGADDFRTREEASQKLAAYGEQARAALEKASRTTQSPEVRWRADQLLRRLAGHDQEQPLGAEGVPPPAPKPEAREQPGTVPDFGSAMERMRQMLEAWQKRPGMTPFGGLFAAHRVVAPGLVLEPRPDGSVKLHVERKDQSGATVTEAFTGHNLKDILARHPNLADHPGMETLRRREAEASWPGLEEFRKHFKSFGTARPVPNGSGFSFATSQGVEIRQDADGVHVKIRERGENGEEIVKEYTGESIEALKKEHPELAEKIGGFTIRIAPPQIFWPGGAPRVLEPLNPTTPRERSTGQARFGLSLVAVGEALASHLGLAPGKGALVDNVLPGGQAEAMGVQRNDVIVKVNTQAVGLDEAADLLRQAGANEAPVVVELIRRGEALTLRR